MRLWPGARIFLIAAVLCLSAFAGRARAEVEVEDLGSAEANARYAALIDELRCPQCQNQNLAASNAPVAADLRGEIRRMLRAGKSDAEIIDALVSRYGDFVLYRPRWQPATYVLWLAPGALLLVAGIAVMVAVRRQRHSSASAAPDDTTQAALARLLDEGRARDADDAR